MKYPIQKNSVQETLIIPLYARALCSERFPQYFKDEYARQLCSKLDYDFSALEAKAGRSLYVFGALETAMRQNDLAFEVKDYLRSHPRASVINLGCGLDNTGRVSDNGLCKIYNLDLPEVIKLRNQLLPAGEREQNIAFDLRDLGWMEQIDASEGAIFFAAGVFYYFRTDEVKVIFAEMAERFKGGRLVFDACGPLGVKMMLKTWVRKAGIKDVGAYLSVKNPAELETWSPQIKAESRGYMRGYQRLGKEVKALYRVLSYIGDRWIGMKIVGLDFAK